MKKLSAFIALIACLSCVCLFGCAGDGDGEYYTTCTVTFNGAGGTAVSGREVQEIHDTSEIKAPVYERTGYTFVGWDTDLTTINKKTTVTAEWRANEYKISFVNEKGEKLFDDKVVTYGEYTGELPTCDGRDGELFYGWCYGDVTIAEGKRWNIASDVDAVATYGYTIRYDLKMYMPELKCDCYMLYKGERTIDTRPIKKGESFEDKLFFTGKTVYDKYNEVYYEVYDLTPEMDDEYEMLYWAVYDVKNSTEKETKKIYITTKSMLTDEIIACADENGVITLSVKLRSCWIG